MLVVFLALLWVPLTAHCQIKSISGLELLQCNCSSSESHSADCSTDSGCCAFESSVYQSIQNHVSVAPGADSLYLLSKIIAAWDEQPLTVCEIPSGSTPKLANVWQFSFRAALPARAPSFA